MYENVSCTVKVNDLYSDWFDVNTGVKQGCILSPTLFALYIDDLAKELNSSAFGIQVNGPCTFAPFRRRRQSKTNCHLGAEVPKRIVKYNFRFSIWEQKFQNE